jgi:hypothetical protein
MPEGDARLPASFQLTEIGKCLKLAIGSESVRLARSWNICTGSAADGLRSSVINWRCPQLVTCHMTSQVCTSAFHTKVVSDIVRRA